MPIVLAILFFMVALLYASVGFGGGSTYNALLILAGTDFRLVPLLALICNIAVVSGNVYRYHTANMLMVQPLLPALIVSIPMAWLGGMVALEAQTFNVLLGFALLATVPALLLRKSTGAIKSGAIAQRSLVLVLVGASCGLLAGLVGIGGGIFLAPVLYLIRWGPDDGRENRIAAACSLFILLNSLAGLAGQSSKLDGMVILQAVQAYWPLVPAVVLGGWIGNHLGIHKFPAHLIRWGTAGLIFIVAIRLLWGAVGEGIA